MSYFSNATSPGMRKTATLPNPPYGTTRLYSDLDELKDRFTDEVAQADLLSSARTFRTGRGGRNG